MTIALARLQIPLPTMGAVDDVACICVILDECLLDGGMSGPLRQPGNLTP
jgi:hypothetical protein